MDDEITEEFTGVLYGRPSKPADSQMEHSELKELIERFMGELSDHDKRLLVLRFAEGRGQEETANELGSTRMKVRTAEAKLRSRLRAFLRHSGYLDDIDACKEA